MSWQQVCQFDLFYSDFPVAVPYSFATDQIVLKIVSRRSANYHKAGLLWSLIPIKYEAAYNKGIANCVSLRTHEPPIQD